MLVFALGQADSSCLPPVAPNPYAATIEMLKHPAKTPPEFVRSARNSLAAAPAAALPSILAAMHEQPLPVVNWLRSAGDDIVDRNLRQGTALPLGKLADIAGNRALSSHARRTALEWCERIQPGFTAGFLPDRLDDPVFAPNAVDAAFQTALLREKASDTAGAQSLLSAAFRAATDPEQAKRVAEKLGTLGAVVDLHHHLGTLTKWQVIGPFAGNDQAGATTAYPPEEQIDLTKRYPGKSGDVAWRAVVLPANESFFDLKKLVAETDDAVAYLATTLVSDREQAVELRATGDDNLQVWLNGKKVIDAPEYYQRTRLDKHRAQVVLKAGSNQLLAKVCEVKLPPGPPSGSPPRWQFSLRIIDPAGCGLSFTPAQ